MNVSASINVNPWILAIRPKTLPAGIAPVMIGTAMALGDGLWHWPSALACLSAALLIQIATNLCNDYFDFKKGADTSDRKGPIRVTQAGLIKPSLVLCIALACFLASLLISLYLVNRAGAVIFLIAIVSIISGILYTAGPKPLGYLGLGELFVFIFFGPVAVAGTYYVQSLELNLAVILAGFAPGFLSCAILAVNNLRDIETDRKANKLTLAVRFGRGFAVGEYLFFMMATMIMPFVILLLVRDRLAILVASLVGFLAINTIRRVMTSVDADMLNRALAQTGRWLFLYSVLFSLGWILCSR